MIEVCKVWQPRKASFESIRRHHAEMYAKGYELLDVYHLNGLAVEIWGRSAR